MLSGQISISSDGKSPHRKLARAAIAMFVSVLALAHAVPVMADMGPCKTAAPTSRETLLMVSDVERAARWYRYNVGLIEERRGPDSRFHGAIPVQLGRDQAGVTLVPGLRPGGFRDPQMSCFVLNGPPAPSKSNRTRFLADPDGSSVELPPSIGNAP